LQEQFAHGALYHFYFRSEDGSTYNGVLTTASVDKNWYYSATDAYSTPVMGEKRGGKKKKETKKNEKQRKEMWWLYSEQV